MAKSSFDTIESKFCYNLDIAIDYMNNKRKIYIIDGYLGWDP